jgi:hypothetical protein
MYRDANQFLCEWKDRPDRKPLVIRGARQVGKSTLVRIFADAHFENLVEINFEQDRDAVSSFDASSPEKTVSLLESIQQVSIIPGRTLLFLDEIQAAPEVFARLRYFQEQMPQLHVVAAGSLLEFILEDHQFSMPVGRIEYLHLGPMNFEEFLLATGKDKRLEALRNFSFADSSFAPLHPRLMDDFRDYCVIGGMPGAVKVFIDSGSYLFAERALEGILATYRDDFNKYGQRVNHDRLQKVFSRLPQLVGQKFKYTNIDREEQSRDLRKSLHLLELARIVHRVPHSDANGIPLGAEEKGRHFKTIFLDVGLLCRACGLRMTDIQSTQDMMLINSGAVCEQFVGQHLLHAGRPFEEPQLHCWMRQKYHTSAEVDYLLQIGTEIVPVEVKAGKTGTLKSLHVFLLEKKRSFALRFNADLPSIHDTKTCVSTKESRDFRLVSLPFYLVGQARRLCQEARGGG